LPTVWVLAALAVPVQPTPSDQKWTQFDGTFFQVVVVLVRWKHQNDQVAPLALIANLHFVTWFLALLMLMAGAGAWLSFEGANTLPPHQADALRWVAWLDLAAVAFFAALWSFRKYLVPETKLGQVVPGLLGLVCLLMAGLWSFLAQWFMPSVTLYALGCCFVGTLLLIRPAITLLVFGLSFAAMYWALGQSPVTGLLLATERLYSGFAAVLGVVLSLVLWHRFTTAELLRIKVQAQRLQLELQNNQLQDMAMLDALTGLLNRRAFEVQAVQAISRTRRDGTSLAALMLDLDHFKRINDQYGHPAGDAVIRFTADVLRASVRDSDLVARVGGEEFMVLLPVTSPEAAFEVAEKIRQRVSQTPQTLTATERFHITHDVVRRDVAGVCQARGLHQLLAAHAASVLVKAVHPLGLVRHHQRLLAQRVLRGHAGGAFAGVAVLGLHAAQREHEAARAVAPVGAQRHHAGDVEGADDLAGAADADAVAQARRHAACCAPAAGPPAAASPHGR
jgi:diguanylate cyclase (GGDEF)-like protein